jgi:hypothetical protein
VLQADNSVRVLLAESDIRDKKINELAAKLHSAEQQQKAAMQTVNLFFCIGNASWVPFRPHSAAQAHMMHQRLEMVFRQNEARAKPCCNIKSEIRC